MVQVHLGLKSTINKELIFYKIFFLSIKNLLYILFFNNVKRIILIFYLKIKIIQMAVPKKKISVSRKRTRVNSIQHKMQNYTQCNKCLNFVPLHRKCSLCKRI